MVGGLPIPRRDHATAIAAAALEMHDRARSFQFPNGLPILLRTGIHSGPVVAGVIGMTKFSYDLWGDTVNIARRMEEMGQAGAIQLSEETCRRIENYFKVESRGLIEVKGHGALPAFWLTGYKSK
jgi:class 3 adenylate cyclase